MRKKYGHLAAFAFALAALLACAAFAWSEREHGGSPDVPAPANALAVEDGVPKSDGLSPRERATNARPLKLPLADPKLVVERSEERRVGKECGAWGSR